MTAPTAPSAVTPAARVAPPAPTEAKRPAPASVTPPPAPTPPPPALVKPAARGARQTANGPRPTAVRSARSTRPTARKTLFPLLTSAPSAVGAAALVIAATGAVTVAQPTEEVAAAGAVKSFRPASAFTGESVAVSSLDLNEREQAVSRDTERAALEDATEEELKEAVEEQAEERSAALAELAASAERYAGEIAANAWQLPLAGYRITARFGYSSSLWANTHTGLDFAAPTGTPVVSVANGVVRTAGWDGSYGYKVAVALEDGTEVWYAHLNSISVTPGQSVTGGQQLGTVGSTGNSTGPHLHLEIRPGAGDAVDPYAALLARGLTP